MMMTRYLLAAIALIILTGPLASAAQALGLDFLHAQARVGNKVCMTEHEHYGEGTMPTKQAAQSVAIRSWSDFTAFEYGRIWGSYRLAEGKRMDCSQTANGWLCKTYARPCRPAKYGPPRRR
ncbi:MAG TPA: hypothetical protein VFX46_02650 [Hyphomicrobiaceae bacterium]|nr:hypothetical protein [Hyphomicrobiaceae bacterium]